MTEFFFTDYSFVANYYNHIPNILKQTNKQKPLGVGKKAQWVKVFAAKAAD